MNTYPKREPTQYFITVHGKRLYPEDNGHCVKIISQFYIVAGPDYNGILEDVKFDGFYIKEIDYIEKELEKLFPKKRLWPYRAKMSRSLTQSGKYQVQFIHPLASKSGIVENDKLLQGARRKKVLSGDYKESANIVSELNSILADPDYWTWTALKKASSSFNRKTVELFYYFK